MTTPEARAGTPKGRQKGSRNSPRKTPTTNELKAMGDAHKILEALPVASRERALSWLAEALLPGGGVIFTTPARTLEGERDQGAAPS